MSPHFSDLILAILSPFFSSISTIFQAQATKLLNPLIVSSVGAVLGSFLLFIILFFRKGKINVKKLKSHSKEVIIMVILRNLFGQLLLAYGLSLTTGIKAIFFTKTEPYFVLFWHWLLKKEKVKPKYLILLLFHIVGAVMLSTGGNFILNKPQIGDLLIILAIGLFSLSYSYGKTLANNIGPLTANAITLGIAGIVLLPFALFINTFPSPTLHQTGWLYLLVSVVLFNVIGLTFWFSSLKTVPAWIVSSLRALGPLLGAPVAFFIFRETLTYAQILGGIIVLITSFIIAREHLSSR